VAKRKSHEMKTKKSLIPFLSRESDKLGKDEIAIRCHELDRIAEYFAGLFSFAQALPFCTLLRQRHAKLRGESLDHKSAEKLAAIILRIHEAKWGMLNDDELAERVRTGREYGNPGNYNSIFPGLNGRMQEFSALLGLEGLKLLEAVATSRNEVAALYKESLSRIPGLTFQCINPFGRCSYKDFTALVDEALFGVSRDGLASALRAEGIDTRNYYDPPVHLHETYKAFRTASDGRLPATERISKSCLSLPIGSHLHREDVVKIASAIERIHGHAEQIMERYVRERKGRKQMR